MMDRKIRLKVCGMRDSSNIREVGALLPDFLGFIFYRGSPRFVGDAFSLPADLPQTIMKVGVFVDEKVSNVQAIVSRYGLQYVQLHGRESVEQCLSLRSDKVKVIKVFNIDDQTNFADAKRYREAADYFLFDTKGKHHGGNARRFNWDVLSRYDQDVPFFLSGGLNPSNIGEVSDLADMNIAALDVNSGVEVTPGMKNVQKVREIADTLEEINRTKRIKL